MDFTEVCIDPSFKFQINKNQITLLRVIPASTCKSDTSLSGITFGILFGIAFGILSGIAFGIVSGIVFRILSGIVFGILSGIAFDILSGIAFGRGIGVRQQEKKDPGPQVPNISLRFFCFFLVFLVWDGAGTCNNP